MILKPLANTCFVKLVAIFVLLQVTSVSAILAKELVDTHAPNMSFSYVKNGVFYLPNGEEVRHLGVNYSPGFAFTYRAIKALNVSHKAAIDMDIAHIHRLGLNAYRIHVWEKEISDKQGNLLKNHHLELLDYTIAEMSKRNIQVILTPVAWWGNGYPEADIPTNAFSEGLSKNEMNENVSAIKATKRYLQQFVNHINQYSGKKYKNDNNIIAFELINEPRHAGSGASSQQYINELVDALKSENVKQALFYNISEQGLNYEFAEAVCNSNIDGITYQWYPTGLVKNTTFNANTLINVAYYDNPFAKLEACSDKAKLIYEFDASDTKLNAMYPAMARSFREAGFQWATQFAYDPSVIAHTNAEYNTHYMNLLYTPDRALGLMIAAEAFKNLPKDFKSNEYPTNNTFANVSLFPNENLSVLKSKTHFIYTGLNNVKVNNIDSLEKIAGINSSKLITYQGSGAYFLDRVKDLGWILELYPDVIELQDPYQTPSLKREVARLFMNSRSIKIDLPSLDEHFYIKRLDKESPLIRAKDYSFNVSPGKYVLANSIEKLTHASDTSYNKFLLPNIKPSELVVVHEPQADFNLGEDIVFNAHIEGLSSTDKISLYVKYAGDSVYRTYPMEQSRIGHFTFTLPKNNNFSRVGKLQYGINIQTSDKNVSFPGNSSGKPNDWDFVYEAPFWQTAIRPEHTAITIFDHDVDQHNLVYPQGGRARWETVAGELGLEFALRLSVNSLKGEHINPLVRVTNTKRNALIGRNLTNYEYIVLNMKAVSKPTLFGFDLIDKDGFAFGAEFVVQPIWQNIVIPITALKPSETILSQAYPGFMPEIRRNTSSKAVINRQEMNLMQGMQFRFPVTLMSASQRENWQSVDIANVYLVTKK